MGALAKLLRLSSVLLTLPPALAHEATHAAAGRLVGARCEFHDLLSTRPFVRVHDWGDASPQAQALVALAPFLAGTVAAVVGLGWLIVAGVPLPEGPRQLLVAGIGAVWFWIYTSPSGDDASVAAEKLREA